MVATDLTWPAVVVVVVCLAFWAFVIRFSLRYDEGE